MTATTPSVLTRIAPRTLWEKLDTTQRWLAVLMFLRLLLDTLFMLNIIPLELRWRWYLQHGGDQDIMMSLARSLRLGVPEESVVGFAQPLVMLPWAIWLDEYFYLGIVVPMVLINGFFMGGLSVLLVGGVARRITRDDRVAIWAAAIWAILPLLAYLGTFWHHDWQTVRSTLAPKLAWLNGLSDGPATFMLLVAVFLLTRRSGKPRFWQFVGIGAALGAAVMYRFLVMPVVVMLLIYAVFEFRLSGLLAMIGAAFITYLPQAWYNLSVFGLPFTTGYLSYGVVANYGGPLDRPLQDKLLSTVFRPQHIIQNITYFIERRFWLMIPLGLGFIISILALIFIWRRLEWRGAVLLLGVPMAYLLPLSMAWNFRDDIIRFSLPVLPALIIASIYSIKQAWQALPVRRAG